MLSVKKKMHCKKKERVYLGIPFTNVHVFSFCKAPSTDQFQVTPHAFAVLCLVACFRTPKLLHPLGVFFEKKHVAFASEIFYLPIRFLYC